MSNSLELLRGPIADTQKKCKIISDIVTEYNDKVHGSQSYITQDNSIQLIVYYEVSDRKKEVKRKFEKCAINLYSITIEQ